MSARKKRCGRCTFFISFRSKARGLCDFFDVGTTPDGGTNCAKFKSIKFNRKDQISLTASEQNSRLNDCTECGSQTTCNRGARKGES